jgi:hypothetical protein
MNTSTIVTAASAAAILLTCTSCTRPPPDKKAATEVVRARELTEGQKKNLLARFGADVWVASPLLFARALRTAPLNEETIPQCGSTSPNAARIVRIRINKNFDVKNTGRDVMSKRHIGGGVKSVPEPDIVWAESTTYDVRLNKNVWDSHNQTIGIKVILKDPDLFFVDNQHAITTIKPNNMFKCVDSVKWAEDKLDDQSENGPDSINPDKAYQVTFYVDEAKIGKQKFNIRVVVLHKDGIHALPIIIDPEVENDGFN